jgi:ATP-dependent protease Clp ATPase subunit
MKEVFCDFCGKHSDFVSFVLVADNTPKKSCICNECVDLAHRIVSGKIKDKPPMSGKEASEL